jgi:hypothetical protein
MHDSDLRATARSHGLNSRTLRRTRSRRLAWPVYRQSSCPYTRQVVVARKGVYEHDQRLPCDPSRDGTASPGQVGEVQVRGNGCPSCNKVFDWQ